MRGRQSFGQALVELTVLLPLFLAIVFGGWTLCRLAVAQTDVHIAATLGAAGRASASESVVREYLARNQPGLQGLAVSTTQNAQVALVRVTCRLVPAWWPSRPSPVLTLTATGSRGNALLCVR